MIGVLEVIYEFFNVLKEQRREPKMVLLSPKMWQKLKAQLPDQDFDSFPYVSLLGVEVRRDEKVKDIYVIDDRGWADLMYSLKTTKG